MHGSYHVQGPRRSKKTWSPSNVSCQREAEVWQQQLFNKQWNNNCLHVIFIELKSGNSLVKFRIRQKTRSDFRGKALMFKKVGQKQAMFVRLPWVWVVRIVRQTSRCARKSISALCDTTYGTFVAQRRRSTDQCRWPLLWWGEYDRQKRKTCARHRKQRRRVIKL